MKTFGLEPPWTLDIAGPDLSSLGSLVGLLIRGFTFMDVRAILSVRLEKEEAEPCFLLVCFKSQRSQFCLICKNITIS